MRDILGLPRTTQSKGGSLKNCFIMEMFNVRKSGESKMVNFHVRTVDLVTSASPPHTGLF